MESFLQLFKEIPVEYYKFPSLILGIGELYNLAIGKNFLYNGILASIAANSQKNPTEIDSHTGLILPHDILKEHTSLDGNLMDHARLLKS